MSHGEVKEADALTHAARLAYGVLAARRSASEAHAERSQLAQAEQLNAALSQLHLSRVAQMTERFRYTRPHMFISPSMPSYVGAGSVGAANQPPMYPTDIPIGADMGMVRLASMEKEAAGFSLPSAIRGAAGAIAGKVRGAVAKATPMGLGHLKAPPAPRAGSVAPAVNAAVPSVKPPRGQLGPATVNMQAPKPATPTLDMSKTPAGWPELKFKQSPQVAPSAPAAPVVQAPPGAPAPGSGQTVGQVAAPQAPKKGRPGGLGTAVGLGAAGVGIGGALLAGKAVDVGGRAMGAEPPPANFYQGGYVVPHSPSAYGYVG